MLQFLYFLKTYHKLLWITTTFVFGTLYIWTSHPSWKGSAAIPVLQIRKQIQRITWFQNYRMSNITKLPFFMIILENVFLVINLYLGSCLNKSFYFLNEEVWWGRESRLSLASSVSITWAEQLYNHRDVVQQFLPVGRCSFRERVDKKKKSTYVDNFYKQMNWHLSTITVSLNFSLVSPTS